MKRIINFRKFNQIKRFSQNIEESEIKLVDHDGIRILSLNRPKSKNALGLNLVTELEKTIQSLRFDKSKVLIINSLVGIDYLLFNKLRGSVLFRSRLEGKKRNDTKTK
jgi:1,4-dihydroxy-2-naphthoyl-CoA synthase